MWGRAAASCHLPRQFFSLLLRAQAKSARAAPVFRLKNPLFQLAFKNCSFDRDEEGDDLQFRIRQVRFL